MNSRNYTNSGKSVAEIQKLRGKDKFNKTEKTFQSPKLRKYEGYYTQQCTTMHSNALI